MKGLLLFGLLLNLPFFGNKTESYQILIALGCSAPRSVQNSYREMLAYEAPPNLLGEKPLGVRVQLILAAITGRSYTAPVRVLETPDPMQSNRFTIEKRVQELKERNPGRFRSAPLSNLGGVSKRHRDHWSPQGRWGTGPRARADSGSSPWF